MKQLYLISCGTGSPEDITIRAANTIQKCHLLMGSERLITVFAEGKNSVTLPAKSSDAAELINICREDIIGILLSGDAGFYSQATQLRSLVTGREILTIPGLSIIQSTAAKLNIPWQDLKTVSMHAAGTLPDIENDTILLMRKGIELSEILADKTDKFDIWIFVSVGMPGEKVFKWDGVRYLCPDLCTIILKKLTR